MRSFVGMLAVGLALTGSVVTAQAMPVHVQRPALAQNVQLSFAAPKLPEGGYYYGVIVLRPYGRYTRHSPPPCSTSSNMQRTDYGYPRSHDLVELALTAARSRTWHWCRDGTYEGAIYAVPHAPPCAGGYPCRSEPYEEPCDGVGPGCVHGVVARPLEWAYPDRLPRPLASGTTLLARFSVSFADH